MKNTLTGKYIIAHDTICEGMQCQKNEEGLPTLYNSIEEAVKEIFTDAICGLEGTDNDYFTDSGIDQFETISEMECILDMGDTELMHQYLSDNQECNYYDEFIDKAEDFVIGMKVILTGAGLHIKGIRLINLN